MFIEPYFARLDTAPQGSALVPSDPPATPGQPVIVACIVPRHDFRPARFTYVVNKTGTFDSEKWWVDGMQDEVAAEVYIFTKNPELELVVGYNFQNSPKHFLLLGRMVDNDPFTEKFRTAFQEFLGQFAKG